MRDDRCMLRDRLIEERSEALSEAAEPVERHSLHQADSATNEFDHELALSQLSAEQDALYEVEAAMRRILDGWTACVSKRANFREMLYTSTLMSSLSTTTL